MRTLLVRIAVAFALLANVLWAFAGGFSIDPSSVQFVGKPQKQFAPGEQVELTFRAQEYFYGGHRFAYAAVLVVPAAASPDQATAAQINGWPLYAVTVRDRGDMDLSQAAAPYVFRFKAPESPGKYRIFMHAVPLFTPVPMMAMSGLKRLFVPLDDARGVLVREAARTPSAFEMVAAFSVSATGPGVEPPPVYLRLDGRVPYEVKTPGGLQNRPLVFSWYVGPEFKLDKSKVLFRYQLAPEDDDKWGAWSGQTQVGYFFLPKGVHQFKVQAKYTDATRNLESAAATYQFTLAKDLVVRPSREALTKAPYGVAPQLQPKIAFDEVYKGSKALLVGMWEFDDVASFPQFDGAKITADLGAMEAALKLNGFEVATLRRSRVTREDIAEELAKLVDRAEANDRLFIYFSTHGFADPLLPADGYLATSDCRMRQPSSRCLRLNDLQTQADRALGGKNVRQVLFAVDSCFSGLGIVRKTAAEPNLNRLAVPQGAFMLTAGMANQLAQIDPGLGMSTFTYFLAEGLKGKAAILGNDGGVITLTELFLYVQYEVARQTDSQQIPMLGRMKGDGEMLFAPTCGAKPCP